MTSSTSETTFTTRGAQLFQPPKSPASSTLAASNTPNDYFSPRTRKRHRPNSSHSQTHHLDTEQHTPWSAIPSWTQCATPNDTECLSSGPIVNERYRLAGGFDTPGLLAASESEHAYDHDFRRCIRDMEPTARRISGQSTVSGPLARERSGAGRIPRSSNSPSTASTGWTSYAFGLVGKVFTFGTNVFKGFYAGGGKGFDIPDQRQQHPIASPDGWEALSQQRIHTPIPGAWQSDDNIVDFEHETPHSPITKLRPPNKRRQTDRDSWVMVGTPETSGIDTSPKRKTSTYSIPRSGLAPRPTASRANSRRSLAPISRRQSSYVTYTGSPSTHHNTTNPSTNSDSKPQQAPLDRRASLAHTRASNSRPSSSGGQAGNPASAASYLTPETERYLKRQARQDKAADRAMNSMSKQLEDMIRQGREALGTKVSVEGGEAEHAAEEVDEGFVDEEW